MIGIDKAVMIPSGKALSKCEYSSKNSDSSVVSLLSTDEDEDDNEAGSAISEDDNDMCNPFDKIGHEENRQDEKRQIIIARVLGPPCGCRRKCRKKLVKNHEIVIFSRFWSLKSKYQQNCYLYNNITIGKPQSSTLKRTEGPESRRTITVYYSVDNGSGASVNVCKTEFMNLHGLQNSFSRINTIIKKKKGGAIITGNRKDRQGSSLF